MPGEQRQAERARGEHEHHGPGGAGAGNPPLPLARADAGKRHSDERDGNRQREHGQARNGAPVIGCTTHIRRITATESWLQSRRSTFGSARAKVAHATSRPRKGPVKRILASVDAWQRRHALAGFPIAVLKKFGEDRASNLAALSAYYAFFSLFPLLLAFVSILGFVLDGNPSLREDVVDTALGRIPVIGAQLSGEIEPLTGSGIALAIGLAGALWAGLGVTVALGRAFAEIWDVPRLEQPGGLKARGRRARRHGHPRRHADRGDGGGGSRCRWRHRARGAAGRCHRRLARRQCLGVPHRLRAADASAATGP